MTAQRYTTEPSRTTAPSHLAGSAHTSPPAHLTESRLLRAAAAGALTVVLLGIAPHAHAAGEGTGQAVPEPPATGAASAAHHAAGDDASLKTLARFFARDGAVSARKAHPEIVGKAVPVYTLSPGFVTAPADRAASTPVAELEVFASEAVSSDGQRASVMAARTGGDWRVVNIATGDDETRYAAMGAKKAPGGTVFQEPQIDAWYVLKGTQVLPLDPDAREAVGPDGTGVAAFHKRVHAEYADKQAGSAYDRKGLAGGFGPNGHGNGNGEPGPRADVRDDVPKDDVRANAQKTAARAGGEDGRDDALGTVGATAGVGALALAAAVGGTWLIRRRTGAARG